MADRIPGDQSVPRGRFALWPGTRAPHLSQDNIGDYVEDVVDIAQFLRGFLLPVITVLASLHLGLNLATARRDRTVPLSCGRATCEQGTLEPLQRLRLHGASRSHGI